jgi:hypothetical protein
MDYDPEYFRYRRKGSVARCLRFRAFIKEGDRVVFGVKYTVEFMTYVLRREQMILLKLRIWRATGTYPRDDN